MKGFTKLVLVCLSALFVCCSKEWDPNKQYTANLSSIEFAKRKEQRSANPSDSFSIKEGMSFGEVISKMGNGYSIVGSLISQDANWMKIEYQGSSGEDGKEEQFRCDRIELLFKNNQLFKIHRYY